MKTDLTVGKADLRARIAELELQNLSLEARIANLLVVLSRFRPTHTACSIDEAEERAADQELLLRRGQGLGVTR